MIYIYAAAVLVLANSFITRHVMYEIELSKRGRSPHPFEWVIILILDAINLIPFSFALVQILDYVKGVS